MAKEIAVPLEMEDIHLDTITSWDTGHTHRVYLYKNQEKLLLALKLIYKEIKRKE